MKKIKIIELGGTISAKGNNRLDFKDYLSSIYGGDDFLTEVPELEDIATITFEPFLKVSSTAIESKHWIRLREKIIHTLHVEGFDGVVLTHGTNTIEETAYFLHLTIPSDQPIVITGSQKPFTALGTDAYLNVLHAVRVAACDAAYGKGVLVMLNESISSAREVTKSNTYRLEAFQSGQFGYLGFVDADLQVVFYRQPTKNHTTHSGFSKLDVDCLEDVAIVYSYAGANGDLIRAITASGNYTGIVTAGTGAGLISPEEYRALQEATKSGLFVVRSSRVGNGRVVPINQYKNDGFIAADNLLPQKARILFMLSLLKYDKVEDIQQVFDTY